MKTSQVILMKVEDLTFDFKNPRLPEFDLTDKSTEDEMIKILWEAMDVKELAMSIAASGFFPHEPVIVAKEGGRNIVIEGNRRLAAVKLLLNPELAKRLNATIPSVTPEAQKAIENLPVLIETRKNAWRYLGFKHVNGPAKWGSYAKALYIADVHAKFSVPLEEIAQQIGDTHKTVQRLFRGLMVIKEAERLKVFDCNDRWQGHFSFSHIYTGISYPGISAFIGLRHDIDERQKLVPSENKEKLRELCRWMYGSKREQLLPVIKKQNPHLRYLEAVVSNREAIAALRANGDLDAAYEVSFPSSRVFEDALMASKRNLQKAHSMFSAGYVDSNDLIRVAGTVANLADDLYEEMNRKQNLGRTGKKQRIMEDL